MYMYVRLCAHVKASSSKTLRSSLHTMFLRKQLQSLRLSEGKGGKGGNGALSSRLCSFITSFTSASFDSFGKGGRGGRGGRGFDLSNSRRSRSGRRKVEAPRHRRTTEQLRGNSSEGQVQPPSLRRFPGASREKKITNISNI